MFRLFTMSLSLFLVLSVSISAAEPVTSANSETETAAERGYRWLTTKGYLPADFDQEVFDSLWQRWPDALRKQAESATPAERRQLTFSRYGFVERPGSEGKGTALGYVDNGKGGWVMNCLACHSGKVAGKVILGVPNSLFALQTLTDDVRMTKLLQGKRLGHMELRNLSIPLGTTRGTTNSVVFGVALGSHRDKDLNLLAISRPVELRHHDMDAPPYWNVHRKQTLYCDGFAPKYHRTAMQFMLLPQNTRARYESWENEFRDIMAWIESLRAPKYPFEIDQPLAETGRVVFEQNCAKCHGTYGTEPSYPERVIPIAEIGTDPARFEALTPEYRQSLGEGWFGDYGKQPHTYDSVGYLAPPLDGIWASAPYFHNGSVPTLWHVLRSSERPAIWRRTEDGYDQSRVGLEIETFEKLPKTAKGAELREYFDARKPSKNAAGHTFPDKLTEEEKRSLLEYLKTL